MDNEEIMLTLKVGIPALVVILGTMAGIIRTKVDKSDFKDHCKNDREDKKEMYDNIKKMSNQVTDIHRMVKERTE